MLVKKGKNHRAFALSRSLRSLGRSVGRKNRKSIVNHVLKDRSMRKKVIAKVGLFVQRELAFTCSQKGNSSFGKKSPADLHSFNWSELARDLKRTMPTLYIILESCLQSKPDKMHMVIAFLGGILIKHGNQKVNLLQRLFSLLMFASHCPKQVRCNQEDCIKIYVTIF